MTASRYSMRQNYPPPDAALRSFIGRIDDKRGGPAATDGLCDVCKLQEAGWKCPRSYVTTCKGFKRSIEKKRARSKNELRHAPSQEPSLGCITCALSNKVRAEESVYVRAKEPAPSSGTRYTPRRF